MIYSFILIKSSATIPFVKDYLRILIHLIDTLLWKFATMPFSFEEYTIYHKEYVFVKCWVPFVGYFLRLSGAKLTLAKWKNTPSSNNNHTVLSKALLLYKASQTIFNSLSWTLNELLLNSFIPFDLPFHCEVDTASSNSFYPWFKVWVRSTSKIHHPFVK